jgi:hypothetical protein
MSSTQTPLYSSTYIWLPSQMPSSSYSFSQSSTESPSFSQMPSPSFSQMPSPSLSRAPSPSVSATQVCSLSSIPTPPLSVLGSISDNTFYSAIVAIVFIFLLNLSYSIHYYNAYTNEKLRRRLVNDQVQNNPYHTNVRDTFNRV